jgi:hypothetical protein
MGKLVIQPEEHPTEARLIVLQVEQKCAQFLRAEAIPADLTLS